ncbi:MAG TPA: deoxyribodipyrimidine photo-lyase [Actinomycetes bacterium]|nr:deoxyribodipyrimidine photo-lyase [Actinomycetes bacterium]
MTLKRSVMWFRRDLRLLDNPALLEAIRSGPEGVLPVFVIDPRLWDAAGRPRRAYLTSSLRELSTALEGALVVLRGDPLRVLAGVSRAVDAQTVHIAADFGPYGTIRDASVERRLESLGVELRRTGSPYAVAPGRVTKQDGAPYQVYTPYYKAWMTHSWPAPAAEPTGLVVLRQTIADAIRLETVFDMSSLPAVGEMAAHRRWDEFLATRLASYSQDRDRPDLPGSSRMSGALKFGEIHPRTLLDDLGTSKSHDSYRKELAWREFYADVLYHRPGSAREYLRVEYSNMRYDTGAVAQSRLSAWRAGRTGYPIVDAGMRQLLAEGWMHNRVRMIVASFLVKDLHLEWQVGARWFMQHLSDGDLASNSHGWQWTAGCGTDAAPYYRIFNPLTQGLRFDPEGDYVRRHVPELRHLSGPIAHEPWKASDGYEHAYPQRVVDHAQERKEALARYQEIKAG